jgi:hypothetical protein
VRKIVVTEFLSVDGVMEEPAGLSPIGMTRSQSLKARSHPPAMPCSWDA